jgi:hypothetical protein
VHYLNNQSLKLNYLPVINMQFKRNSLLFLICLLFSFQKSTAVITDQLSDNCWKAGVSRAVITPEESLWMAGYASRDHASEGVLHDLWTKVLAIEDARGNKAVLITNDLLEIPKQYSDRIRDRLEKEYGLQRSQVILNCSHTIPDLSFMTLLQTGIPLMPFRQGRSSPILKKLRIQLLSLPARH